MHPGEAASPGQAALSQEEHEHHSALQGQDLPFSVPSRSQESIVAVGEGDNSPGERDNSSGWHVIRANIPLRLSPKNIPLP